MQELMTELEARGLKPELTHTGGGVMVAFIETPTKIIGVDGYTVCVYDLDLEFEECVYCVGEEIEDEQTANLELANHAHQTFNALTKDITQNAN